MDKFGHYTSQNGFLGIVRNNFLSSIVIGPTSNKELAKKACALFLEKEESHPFTGIKNSEIPYRT